MKGINYNIFLNGEYLSNYNYKRKIDIIVKRIIILIFRERESVKIIFISYF